VITWESKGAYHVHSAKAWPLLLLLRVNRLFDALGSVIQRWSDV